MKAKKKPWHWRWLVVLSDKPPMPPHKEIVHGTFTRREAERRCRNLRGAYTTNGMIKNVEIYITRKDAKNG